MDGIKKENLHNLIKNKQWIRLKEILLASPRQTISDLMDSRFISLNANDDQETAIKSFRDYDRVALPVVSAEGVLIGIVTVDDIIDVEEEESTEDFHKFGAFKSAIGNSYDTFSGFGRLLSPFC